MFKLKRDPIVGLLVTVIIAGLIAAPAFSAAGTGDLIPGTPLTDRIDPVSKAPAPGSGNPNTEFIGDSDGNGISDDLDSKLDTMQGGEKVGVIVTLVENPSDKVLQALSAEAGPITTKARWEHAIKGFSGDMTAAQIRALARNPKVVRVELDREVTALLGTATSWTGVQAARSNFGVDGDRDGSATSYSKTDLVIAVIDTGIDRSHVDLDQGKVIGWYDVINGQSTPYDDHGHGTHVASIAAGTGEGSSAYRGVAPGAALVGIKVLNSSGSGSTTGIISGINWMIQNKNTYGIRIANMSLGSSGSSDGTDSLSQAVNNAVNNGIIMVVAAGNDGPSEYTIGSPAAAANAITVGALYDPGEKGWVLAEFSSRGLTADGRIKPDIATPGRNITAAKAGSGSGYVTYSGTSMATPFMAGVIALMLDANYSLSDTGVKNIVYSGSNVKDFGPAGNDRYFGHGINLSYDVVKQAGSYTGSFSDGLTFGYGEGYLSGSGDSDWWQFTVIDASKPIGITCVIRDHSFWKDFDIYLYDPNGSIVASSTGTTAQEQILFMPSVTGTYQLRVYSYWGSGNYWVNVSWK